MFPAFCTILKIDRPLLASKCDTFYSLTVWYSAGAAPSALTVRACALWAIWLFGRQCPNTVGWRKTFWRVGRFFFTKTKCQKIDPMVPNRPSCRAEGYKRAIDEIWGPIAKNEFSGRNPKFWAQKEHTPLRRNHVLAMTGQSCAKKKVPFSQINVCLLVVFECFFFWIKNGFSARFPLFGKT